MRMVNFSFQHADQVESVCLYTTLPPKWVSAGLIIGYKVGQLISQTQNVLHISSLSITGTWAPGEVS